MGFGILSAWALLVGRQHIQIRNDEVILESWLRRQAVLFPDISGVDLRTIAGSKGSRVLVVVIERWKRKPITLGAIREGSIALYESLLYHETCSGVSCDVSIAAVNLISRGWQTAGA